MIHIITGSTLGGAEYVGDHLSELLEQSGLETQIHNQPSVDEIGNEGIWLLITSTHGAGEYPDNIQPFIGALQDTPPRMSNVKFAVIAIGDSSYDTFCAAGKHAYDLLEDIGGTPLTDCLEIDILEQSVPEDAAEAWLKQHIERFQSA
ncbi:FMN-binding protein MioC [Vibrio sp. WXL103]|uniref:FMN-binding protein MioC n=1 Tax=Vibrio sp. WXL103 TaxID=3450710 RepID=UPI003EC5100B